MRDKKNEKFWGTEKTYEVYKKWPPPRVLSLPLYKSPSQNIFKPIFLIFGMYFHIITTVECNSQCRYCYKKSWEDLENSPSSGKTLNENFNFDFATPPKIEYPIEDLKKFLSKEGSHTLTFYGGEPLTEIDKIKEIMDKIPARYMIQTNGLLLDKLDKKYVNQFKILLVSIDGIKEITDFNRGKGTYEKVMSNINIIRKNGFSGEIIARMVVDEYSNVSSNVKHLFEIGFDSVHWQLDAGFYSSDFSKRKFADYIKKYNLQVKELANWWLEEMAQGRVRKIYPFLGIFESLYYGKKEKLRCGSGYANYTISTNGNIAACPIMHDAQKFQVGNISSENPEKLKKIYVASPCTSCDIKDLCGGRCLYANKAKLWPEEGENLICDSVRNLIDSIKKILPQIKALIEKGTINLEQFNYEKYSGPEIIP